MANEFKLNVETWGVRSSDNKVLPYYRYYVSLANVFTGEEIKVYVKPNTKGKHAFNFFLGTPNVDDIAPDHIGEISEDKDND